jgi:hypothetical protein
MHTKYIEGIVMLDKASKSLNFFAMAVTITVTKIDVESLIFNFLEKTIKLLTSLEKNMYRGFVTFDTIHI